MEAPEPLALEAGLAASCTLLLSPDELLWQQKSFVPQVTRGPDRILPIPALIHAASELQPLLGWRAAAM
ncbi:hypothetical protein Y1Q_0001578 [Alligator mississippiensis]|uniref:Uncharacterized protein n=1 Tax=Alligator mississippiensis TaxID=8496 RepID=A0A151MA18_ALLMI|nr:hypothetical protein Y1Q_0001578 [Alligator mississippiensis]